MLMKRHCTRTNENIKEHFWKFILKSQNAIVAGKKEKSN